MSVQRFDSYGYMPSPEGKNMRYDDHARIVAEATAEARAAERRHWEARFRNAEQAHAAALAEAKREGWEEGHLWRNSHRIAFAPRTLTADDAGYHSQRCLHCDHIRAAHALTASGCLGHAVPGREGAYCPCSEFIHDGEATPQDEHPLADVLQLSDYLWSAKYGMCGGCGKANEDCCGGCKESLCRRCPERIATGEVPAMDGEATT